MVSAITAGARLQTQYFATGVSTRRNTDLRLILLRIEGPREAHDERDVRLALQRQVRQHVAHQGLIDQQSAERLALPRMVDRLRDALAHETRSGGCIVEAGVDAHFQDRLDAAALLSNQQARRYPRRRTSLEALEWLPSLSFSRCSNSVLTVRSGRKRGTKKHDKPPGACASTRNASHIGAEKNHL